MRNPELIALKQTRFLTNCLVMHIGRGLASTGLRDDMHTQRELTGSFNAVGVPFTPRGLPSCPRMFSLRAASVASALKLTASV